MGASAAAPQQLSFEDACRRAGLPDAPADRASRYFLRGLEPIYALRTLSLAAKAVYMVVEKYQRVYDTHGYVPIGQRKFAAEVGISVDVVAEAIEDLTVPTPCPYCLRAHAFIETRRGGVQETYEYRLVRDCSEIPSSAVLPVEAVVSPARRVVSPQERARLQLLQGGISSSPSSSADPRRSSAEARVDVVDDAGAIVDGVEEEPAAPSVQAYVDAAARPRAALAIAIARFTDVPLLPEAADVFEELEGGGAAELEGVLIRLATLQRHRRYLTPEAVRAALVGGVSELFRNGLSAVNPSVGPAAGAGVRSHLQAFERALEAREPQSIGDASRLYHLLRGMCLEYHRGVVAAADANFESALATALRKKSDGSSGIVGYLRKGLTPDGAGGGYLLTGYTVDPDADPHIACARAFAKFPASRRAAIEELYVEARMRSALPERSALEKLQVRSASMRAYLETLFR